MLESLHCEDILLETLNIANNTALQEIMCQNNRLTGLDVTNNTALEYLACWNNYIPDINNVTGWESVPGLILYDTFNFYPQRAETPLTGEDITASFTDPNFLAAVRQKIEKSEGAIYDHDVAGIQILDVSDMGIYSLAGIENFTGLTVLICENNQLVELDISNNVALTMLNCPHNQLTELDVSNNTLLYWLNCNDNQLTALNVTNNPELRFILCERNYLSELDVSNNTVLTDLYCVGNQLTTLNVSNNTVLTGLYCGGNQLTALDVSNNTELLALNCNNNQLKKLDLSGNAYLTGLGCAGNQLSALEVSGNTDISFLDCSYNQLTALYVSNNNALTFLRCRNNQLTALDVSNNTLLYWLDCADNQLTALDVSSNTALTRLECQYNNMTSPDDVIGWRQIPALILDDTFIFYPQNGNDTHETSIASVTITVTAPVVGAVPDTTATGSGNFTIAAVTWSPGNTTFKANTTYTATVKLTAINGYNFTGLSAENVIVNGQAATVKSNTGTVLTLTCPFVALPPEPPEKPGAITNVAITVTAPVTGAAPNTTATGSGNFTVAAVTWSPNNSTFKANTPYTATVKLTAVNGYNFTGILTENVTVNGQAATVKSNTGTVLTLTYTFTAAAP
jgi:hypothetical protein